MGARLLVPRGDSTARLLSEEALGAAGVPLDDVEVVATTRRVEVYLPLSKSKPPATADTSGEAMSSATEPSMGAERRVALELEGVE